MKACLPFMTVKFKSSDRNTVKSTTDFKININPLVNSFQPFDKRTEIRKNDIRLRESLKRGNLNSVQIEIRRKGRHYPHIV
ncbi:MAG: hypothetical protein K2K65_11210, partial [Duncaniella sp.]|nr:hypothetical protein [Duncaniella sp.]